MIYFSSDPSRPRNSLRPTLLPAAEPRLRAILLMNASPALWRERLLLVLVPALAARRQVPVVATNDVRFIKSDDFEAHEVRVTGRQEDKLFIPDDLFGGLRESRARGVGNDAIVTDDEGRSRDAARKLVAAREDVFDVGDRLKL